ncbi:hypothetical protein ACHWQZ_G009558 [Mnemiopsis leidyi]
MQMNHMYELQKQMNATPVSNNQFAMHAQLLGANPQHQAILNQQHLLSQQLSQQQAPLSPILAPLKRGRKANEDGDSRKRRKKDPNRPKRAMTPYFFFTAEYRNSLRREGKAVPGVKEVAQYCGPKWNGMSEEEKRPFVESAERDRKRYLGEMNIYKKPRDEDKPKRPASAYFHFLVEFRKKMAGKPLPEHTTIPKLSGALWQKMTEEERRPYNTKMEEEKKVYEKKLAEYRKKKAEEAIKTAQNKESEQKEESTYSDYRGAFDGSSQNSGINMLSQYSDLNRHIQMMTSQDNKTWQAQLQNMQAAQAAHHYNSYHYSEMYNSPGSSSHSGQEAKLQDTVQNMMIPNALNSTSLPSIQSLQSSWYSTNGPLGGTPASTGGAAHADTPGPAEAAQATSGGAAAVRPAEERGGAE